MLLRLLIALLLILCMSSNNVNVFAKDDGDNKQNGDFIGVAENNNKEEVDFQEGEIIVKYKGDSEPFHVE